MKKMKILFGKEILNEDKFNTKDHKISLEDDREYKELKIEPKIFCLIPKDDIIKIIKFIRDAQILGVDNEAVKLMYGLKNDLITKIEERKVESIINQS